LQNQQERDTNERETFRRCRTVVESQDRQGIEDFNRSQLDETRGRAVAEDAREDATDLASETSAAHADRIERAKEGL
jgi:hypothetical protein